MALLNVGSAIALWLLVTTLPLLSLLPHTARWSPLALSLLVFNNLNIFIAMCEICLGFNIGHIQRDYEKLRLKYHAGNEWGACVDYLTMPLTPRQLFDAKVWSRMWSTYALYDPSYQNRESFGFFIDFGNGFSTIPPMLLINAAVVLGGTDDGAVSPLWAGCVGLASYWQIMYGAMIYGLSYAFNGRYVGKSKLEVGLFVGSTNGLWIVFPAAGIYACVCMLRDGNMDVFR